MFLTVALAVGLILALLGVVRLSIVCRSLVRENRETDSLTGLMNRSGFESILEQNLKASVPFGVAWLDLDGFRQVNEQHGYTGGDRLLKEVGPRIRQCLRPGDAVARFGGDQFLIMVLDRDQITPSMKRILTGLDASVGISLFPEHAGSTHDLLRFAQTAMHQAKTKARGGVVAFDPAMAAMARRGAEIARLIESALANDHFRLVYQPVINETGEVVRMESLVRIEDPALGRVAPLEFIGVAEQTGLIHEVGEWILRTACQQAREWQDAGHSIQVTINLSPLQLASNYQADGILKEVTTRGPGCAGITIHVTGAVPAAGPVERLRNAGMHISSQHWSQDRSDDRALFDGIRIWPPFEVPAQRSGLTILAQGIENSAQLAQARAAGCHLFQGFFVSQPLEADIASSLLRKGLGSAGDRLVTDQAAD